MSSHLLDPLEIKPLPWMNRSERALFRRLIREETASNRGVSRSKVDKIADYISACTRLDELRERLAKEVAENSSFDSAKARIIALNASINALAAQRAKLAAAL